MKRLNKVANVKGIHSLDVKHSRIGIGFEKLDRNVFDPEKAYDKIAAIGVKWTRIQSGWARTEKEKGVYDFSWLDSIVDNLLKRGLEPWVCLCYGNGLYDDEAQKVFGAVGCPPVKNDEQKKAWHNYVSALAEHFKGRVGWYEVWNEPDGQWCWKHGVSGTEYGELVKMSATAVKKGDSSAKMIGGSTCLCDLKWLSEVFETGAGQVMDALTFHAYSPDETCKFEHVHFLRNLCRYYNPKIEIIQGETGAQSRSDGAGALCGAAWTPERQAKFLTRHMMVDLLCDVKFASYFSSVDMIEALNGLVSDKSSYLDYGYFGVLASTFDENGFSSGDYKPKPSYYALQNIASIFREDFSVENPAYRFFSTHSGRLLRNEDNPKEIISGGFKKPNGSFALVYWKSTELLTTDYEATITLEIGLDADSEIRLVDPLDGTIYELPETMINYKSKRCIRFNNIPLKDTPLLLTFGNFV